MWIDIILNILCGFNVFVALMIVPRMGILLLVIWTVALIISTTSKNY